MFVVIIIIKVNFFFTIYVSFFSGRERSASPQVQGTQGPQIMRKRGYEQTNGMDGQCCVDF